MPALKYMGADGQFHKVDAGNADTVGGKTPGAVNGIATLDATGKLTASQAPSSSGGGININTPNYWVN